MKYLTLIPDYTGSCIQDDYNGRIELSELNLPGDLIGEIEIWHELYRAIIPLSEEQRLNKLQTIEQLDLQGLQLAKKISQLIPGGAKVRYYSEGKYKYLYSSQ